MGDEPKRPSASLLDETQLSHATPHPRPSPGSSDATRLRPLNSHPDLLEEPPDLPLAAVDGQAYDVGEEVARGGLGRIIRAYDKRLHRVVAVKLLRARDPHAEVRFMREALITARLQHPAIVPVYEAGRWPDGEPFYAMKLVSGKALSELIAERPQLAARLALLPNVIAVADAIAYAHQHRVIHRDLKPANIMVGDHGETLVIDWGLAKDLDAAEPPAPEQPPRPPTPAVLSAETIAGSVLGTPAYMPPEQAQGQRADERADVYALGAVLYHVLTGKIPLDDLSPAEAMHRVMLGPLPDVARVVDGVPEDLAAIVRKAMAFERDQRYPSARELAADLRRFQEGKLVSVRTYFWWERAFRFAQRHRAVVAVAAVAALACLAVGLVSVRRVVEERNNAIAARREADRRSDELVLVQATTALDRDPTAALAWLRQHPGGDALAKLRTVASDAQARGVARHVFRVHEQRVNGVAFGAAPHELYSAGSDGRLLAYDLRTGAVRPVLEPPALWWSLAQSADRRRLAVSGSGGAVQLLEDGKLRALETDGSQVLALELSPDGRRLAAGTVSGKVWLWELDSGARRELDGHAAEVRDLVFSGDGERLASASWDGSVRLHAAGGGSKLVRAHPDEIFAVDFSPDGRLLATGGADGTVRLWDEAGALHRELTGHKGQVTHLKFGAGGLLVTASRDRTVRAWAPPYQTARVLEGHTGDVSRVALHPNGRLVASTGADMTVRVWELGSPRVRVLQGHEAWVSVLAFSADGRWLASGGQDSSVRVWEVDGAGERLGPALRQVALSPNGAARAGVTDDGRLVAVGADGAVRTLEGRGWRFVAFVADDLVLAMNGERDVLWWAPSTGAQRTLGRLAVDLGGAALASGWLAVASYDGMVRVWRRDDGEAKVWPAHKTYTLGVAAAPGGTLVASSGEEGMLKLFDVTTGASRELAGHVGPVHQLRVSPDGKLLASGDMNGEARVWDLASGQVIATDRHRGFVRTVALSRDGAFLASAGDDKVVRVRGVASAEAVALGGPEQAVLDVDFSPDGALVAAGSGDRTVRVFDWRSGASRVLRGHTAQVTRVQFVTDGTLMSVDADGLVLRWTRDELMPLPDSREGLQGWIDAMTSAHVDAEHRPATAAGRTR